MKSHFKLIKEKLTSKEFLIKELKSISFSDILIWIAIALLFIASWQNIQAGKDPCSYCFIKSPTMKMTCKEYIEIINPDVSDWKNKIEANFSGSSVNANYGNIKGDDIRETNR
jgi:hypothetical protein